MSDLPETLMQAVRYFSDVHVCNDLMRQIKWPGSKPTCPHCQGDRIAESTDGKRLQCRDCRKKCSYKTGTIFEDSPLGLPVWFVAVWSIANCKNGISSHELARATGITQKSAWFVLHRIRAAMKSGTFTKLNGTVESDETFIGGEARNMHAKVRERKIKGRGAVGKTIVHGILQRTTDQQASQIRAAVVPNTEAATLVPAVRSNVEKGATVYTDAASSYNELAYTHDHHSVDHIERYVDGLIHTNGLENFWSLLKRGIKGTYVQIAPYHLFRYVDEQAFRFNERLGNDLARFLQAMRGIVGRRLTWRVLTAQDDCGFMGIT